jgi:plastocyanin
MLQAALAVLAVAAPGPAEVSIVDNAFKPRVVAVRRGRAVVWRWKGQQRHDVWFQDGPRRCPPRRSGSCTRRFRRAGTYDYYCTLHGSMSARVLVRRPR